jgi:hypothetical protein
MPRYFFHVREDSEIHDDHGIVLPNEHAAKRHGIMMLGKILRDEPQAFWASGRISVVATRDDGTALFTLETTAELAEMAPRQGQGVQQLFPPKSPIRDSMAADPRQRQQ